MEEQDILYDTLSPLAVASTDTPPPPSSSPELEPYVVFRNQISLNSIALPVSEVAAQDYFSLDLKEDDVAEDTPFLANPRPSKAKARPSIPAQEKNLEGNWFQANSRFKSPMIRLHKEILDFCDFLSPTPEEQDLRNAAIESVFGVIKYIWPNAKPNVFGSYKTGLYLPSSDIDLVIMDSFVPIPKMGLNALSRALSQKGIAKKIQVIAKARVPIIKFVEKKSGFAFDVSFDAHNGPQAAEYIQNAVCKWPPLRPLCLILKIFLQQRELNEVYTGGIGSYALLAMLIAMLRTQHESQNSAEHNLGILLVKFFEMYGCKLNQTDVGVSCNSGAIFFQKTSKGFVNDGRPHLLAIEDPQNPENDIGKNSFNYNQAKTAFSMAYTALTNSNAILHLDPNRSILGAIIRPDSILLERKGGSNGKQTFNNLFPVANDPLDQLLGDQHQELYGNWRLNDDDEPLPRGNVFDMGDNSVKSSGKKRKSPKEKSGKKSKGHNSRNGERFENGSVESSKKKHKRSKYQDRVFYSPGDRPDHQ